MPTDKKPRVPSVGEVWQPEIDSVWRIRHLPEDPSTERDYRVLRFPPSRCSVHMLDLRTNSWFAVQRGKWREWFSRAVRVDDKERG